MAKNTISMKRFRANLTKISRLAKSGYNSITSVAKQIISTVTTIASKISVVSPGSGWQGASKSLPETDNYQAYYDGVLGAQERFLNTSLSNLMNYKDEIIHDIFTVSDAMIHNSDQIYFGLEDALRTEFDNLKSDFFSYGKTGGQFFGNGFKESITACMNEVKKTILESAEQINAGISVQGGGSSVITYSSPSYNFYTSRQTVTEQLSEARKAETVNAMRRT